MSVADPIQPLDSPRLTKAKTSPRQRKNWVDLALHAPKVGRANPPDRRVDRKGSSVAKVISTLRILTAPQNRAAVVRTLTAQLGSTRVQPGCRTCDLYQDVENPEAITLVEEWETQGGLSRRLRSEEYRAVLAAIELSQEQPEICFDTVIRRGGLEVVVTARA